MPNYNPGKVTDLPYNSVGVAVLGVTWRPALGSFGRIRVMFNRPLSFSTYVQQVWWVDGITYRLVAGSTKFGIELTRPEITARRTASATLHVDAGGSLRQTSLMTAVSFFSLGPFVIVWQDPVGVLRIGTPLLYPSKMPVNAF